MPSCAVHQQHGVSAPLDGPTDLFEVQLHGVGICIGKSQSSARSSGGTDGTEQIHVLIALIGRLAWSRSALRPLPDDAVLLADAGFVLPPDLDLFVLGQVPNVSLQRAREVFLYSAITRASCPG